MKVPLRAEPGDELRGVLALRGEQVDMMAASFIELVDVTPLPGA